MLLQAVRGSTKRCSEAAERKVAAAGGCAQPVHLQQMRSSAPRPQDIPFTFRTLAVVAGSRPAVWTVGCCPWKVALGARVRAGLITEQGPCIWEQSLGTGGPFG